MPVTNHQEPLDSIEASLIELSEAGRAGVFRRTNLPKREAPDFAPTTVRFPVRSVRRLAIAAVLVLAAGVWTMMFRSNLTTLQNRSRLAETVQLAGGSASEASLARCIAGPSGTIDPTCGAADFDGDGDVDLADYRSFQTSYAVKQ